MTQPVRDLVDLLKVEPLELNLFRGVSGDVGSPRVFGGQVLGQALMAAALTVEGRTVHSLHAYFLRPGDKAAPIVYEVERIRDGGSFTTRRVVAIQHGRPIFNMAASFHAREDGVEHQTTMPDVPPPEALASENDLRRESAHRMPPHLQDIFTRGLPIDIRPLHPRDMLEPVPDAPRSDAWFRIAERLPDDPLLHQAMLAYASDFNLLRTSMLPHGLSFFQRNVQSASLDHAMWIHRDFRIDDWLLYVTDSPSAGSSRGFCRGTVYTRDGRLVASVAQEGLVRVREPRAAP